jgi:hypothetical protein
MQGSHLHLAELRGDAEFSLLRHDQHVAVAGVDGII